MHKILIVDDHQETLQVVSLILRQNGYTVLTAENGQEGVEMAVEHAPHLILMDVMMPVMDGAEACRHIRQIPELQDVPIIMFTVKAQTDDKWAGFQAGADDYLIKPTDPEELLGRIAALLARSGAGEEDKAAAQKETTGAFDSAPLKHGRLVLFVGARGGAGATTAAIHFAATLANLGQPALLADFDMVQGHIALYLKQKIRGGLNALTQLNGTDLRLEVPQHIATYEGGWQLLLSQVNLDYRLPFFHDRQVEVLLKTLMRPERWIVADLGCGIRSFHEPLLRRADHIFVCLRPERVAISAARLLLRRLSTFCREEATLQPLMLDFSEHSVLSQRAVEEFLQYPLAGIVPIKPAQMTQFANNAQLLTQPAENNAAADVFSQMVKALIA
jgi:CheY-like chemotaxis protein/cellulose biosynthesis protein BcsQ